MLNLLLILIIAIIIDIIWGELPTQIHPVVWMGKAVDYLSTILINWNSRISGLVLTTLTSLIFVIIFYLALFLASFSFVVFIIVAAVLLSTTFAIKGLYSTASEVQKSLEENLNHTRELVSFLVSRDTNNLSKSELASATVESLTENINDSVTAPLFYIFLIGILISIFSTMTSIQTYIPNLNDLSWLIEIKNPFTTTLYSYTIVILPVLVGVVYRVINTLDAMVGYENLKYQMIGWFPANLDDILNFIPSRVTGILIVIAAGLGSLDWKKSWLMMKRDAKKTPSPNSGYPMAAAAGALNVQLEKPGVYILGAEGNQLDHRTIEDAIFLTKITISLFVVVGFIIYISFLYLTI